MQNFCWDEKMKLDALVLKKETTLKDAIRLMDHYGYGVLPIVDVDNKFYGLITDGDIRKALLNDVLDLEHIINKNSMVMGDDSTQEQRKQFLKQHKRRHLPIVDSNNNYVQMFMLDELDFNSKPNAVVIMAGGLGSRLGELTKETPKPMLKVGNKPILQTILETYVEHGFRLFYFSVNYKKEQIMEYFGDGSKWGVEIKYLVESKRLGTGGALSLLKDKIDHPFIVANADVFTSIDYESLLEQHLQKNATATMCTREHDYTVPYGVVHTDENEIVSLEEKPTFTHLINSGVYLLDPKVLAYVPKDTFYDLPTLFEMLISKGEKCSTFTIDSYWVDIGLVEEYESIKEKLGY